MIDTNIESLAIKAEIKQKLREEMGNSISEDDMKFLILIIGLPKIEIVLLLKSHGCNRSWLFCFFYGKNCICDYVSLPI